MPGWHKLHSIKIVKYYNISNYLSGYMPEWQISIIKKYKK